MYCISLNRKMLLFTYECVHNDTHKLAGLLLPLLWFGVKSCSPSSHVLVVIARVKRLVASAVFFNISAHASLKCTPPLYRSGYGDPFLLYTFSCNCCCWLQLAVATCTQHIDSGWVLPLNRTGFFTHSASAAAAVASYSSSTTSLYTWDGNPITVIVIIIQRKGQASSHGALRVTGWLRTLTGRWALFNPCKSNRAIFSTTM